MERMMHRLLLAWALLWGACILTQVLPFPVSARLGYWFFLVVVLTSPVVLVLVFLHVVLGLREAFYRLRVLRRAVKWKRKEPRTRWPEEEWDG
jgi:CBS-domain-containing membrane protein